jgi:hypothetical protein
MLAATGDDATSLQDLPALIAALDRMADRLRKAAA